MQAVPAAEQKVEQIWTVSVMSGAAMSASANAPAAYSGPAGLSPPGLFRHLEMTSSAVSSISVGIGTLRSPLAGMDLPTKCHITFVTWSHGLAATARARVTGQVVALAMGGKTLLDLAPARRVRFDHAVPAVIGYGSCPISRLARMKWPRYARLTPGVPAPELKEARDLTRHGRGRYRFHASFRQARIFAFWRLKIFNFEG